MHRFALSLLCCVVVASWASSTFAQPIVPADGRQRLTEARAELTSLKGKIEEHRVRLRELDSKERSLLDGVGHFDEDLARLEELERIVTAEEAQLQEDYDEATTHLDEARRRVASTEQRIRSRLRSLYVLGHGANVRVILGAQRFEDLAVRRRVLQSLARLDEELLQEYQRSETELQRRKEKQRFLWEQTQAARRQLEEQRELLREARAERDALMERIEGEKELQMRAVRELVHRQRELTMLVGDLSATSLPRHRTSRFLQAGLQRPTAGPVERRFGVTRVAETGAKVTSNGIEISAPRGAPVVAPADGVVVHVGWVRGFGRLVILDHGDGYHSLHAHLATTSVNQGAQAQRGEILGTVGDTESLRGTQLYFELRHHGRPLDPLPYLR
ncbi:MAG: murein hydrolase activator EnvC family protein [Myxococcota bacterium]